MSKPRLTLAILCGSMMILGCAAGSPVPPPVSEGWKPSPEDEVQRLAILEAMAESSGIDSPPEVAATRWVPTDEAVQVQADCLSAEGYEIKVEWDGLEASFTAEQEGAFRLATYVCQAQYPEVPRPTGAPSVEALGVLYDYFVGDLRACIEDQGHELVNVPSLETYVETFFTPDQWSPYRDMPDGRYLDGLREACRQNPTDGRLDAFM